MSDELDRAAEAAEVILNAQILSAQNSIKGRALEPKEFCYNCSNEVPPDFLYCDSDCREDHEYRIAAALRNCGSHQC